MPLPEPRNNETHDDFRERCMGDETAVSEFPEEDQRYAVCETQWRERENRSIDMENKFYKYLTLKSDFNEKDFTVTATASKEIVDRDGDIIKVKGIDTKNWKKNPVIMLFHNYADFPVGMGVGRKAWVENDELKIKFKFLIDENEKAFQAARLWKAGALRGLSVGFIADHNEIDYPEKDKKVKGPNRVFNKVELLEVSVVPIPANQEALMASVNKSVENGEVEEEDVEILKGLLEEAPEVKNDISDEEEDKINRFVQKLAEKDQKILELEQKIKEYELEQELGEVEVDDNYLKQLYDEFVPSRSKTEPDAEQNKLDAYIKEVLK